MKASSVTDRSGVDWFARITAILGLIVALAAVVVPLLKDNQDKQEQLTIVAKPEGSGGIIRLSSNESKSNAVQIPWIITLSNTGRTKLSVVSYRIAQLTYEGMMFFTGLDGGISDRNNKPMTFPVILGDGEIVSFRLHLGFEPTIQISQLLKKMYRINGPLDAHKTFLALAEKSLTIYGGKASMLKYEDDSYKVSIDPNSLQNVPIYNVAFLTGRNQEFSIKCSAYSNL